MARQRFQAIQIKLPVLPGGQLSGLDMETYTRTLETVLLQLATPRVLPVHEIDMVEPPRCGVVNGTFLPTGAVYVDENLALKMVDRTIQQWMPPTVMTVTGGFTAV